MGAGTCGSRTSRSRRYAKTAKVKVDWCGLCGSDLHEYQAGPTSIPTEETHTRSPEHLPAVTGHEFAGTVAEAGPGATGLLPGDRRRSSH